MVESEYIMVHGPQVVLRHNVMKILITILLLIPTLVFAQDKCEWKVKSVDVDEVRGSIVVRTAYSIDEYFVLNGETRYDEQSGSALHVTRMIRNDLNQECAYLLKTPFIPNKFYQMPDVKDKKLKTKDLLKKLKRLEGKSGNVKKVFS